MRYLEAGMAVFFFIALLAITTYLGWGCEQMRKGFNNHRQDKEPIFTSTGSLDRRQVKLWRWVFVCLETVLITLLSIGAIQSSRGYTHLASFTHPMGVTV